MYLVVVTLNIKVRDNDSISSEHYGIAMETNTLIVHSK